jgi:SAM-dependent methyltransferase
MSTHPPVSYGPHVADDSELRLCGDLTGKRAVELGLHLAPNALALAKAGAKVIVVDPSDAAIAAVRRSAEAEDVRLECHASDLADLGFITSASVDLVLLVHRLTEIDDLARLLRQVHRVLKPEAPLVIATEHPASVLVRPEPARYGDGHRPIGELFMALQRANFRVDVIHELDAVDQAAPLAPAVLVLRARKLGV